MHAHQLLRADHLSFNLYNGAIDGTRCTTIYLFVRQETGMCVFRVSELEHPVSSIPTNI